MMKKQWKQLAVAGALVGACMFSANGAQAMSTDVSLVINGTPVYTDASVGAPYITDNGRTMMPLRVVSESLACDVTYVNGKVYIESDRNHFSAIFEKDADYFYLNRERVPLDAPMTVSGEGRSYVPARALTESFGTVEWDAAARTVTIDTVDWDMDPETANTLTIPGTPYELTLQQGDRMATHETLYVVVDDTEQLIGVYLTAPEEMADWFVPENKNQIRLHDAKVIDGMSYVGVAYTAHPATDFWEDIVACPLDGESGKMIYIGNISRSSDYTLDDTYLYSTQGLYAGPSRINPNRLYIDKIGDSTQRLAVDVDFAINACTLSREGDDLIAVDLDGNRHVLNVQELLANAK